MIDLLLREGGLEMLRLREELRRVCLLGLLLLGAAAGCGDRGADGNVGREAVDAPPEGQGRADSDTTATGLPFSGDPTPQCAPHPPDVLAIMALYQSAPTPTPTP